jgi:hypothetical protein
MEHYIHDANMAHYRHLIAESERDPDYVRNYVDSLLQHGSVSTFVTLG